MATTETYILLAGTLALQATTLYMVALRHKRRPEESPARSTGSGAVIVDTCALIDGRIRDLLDAGFITQQLYIPSRVVQELQYLADHGDAHKRSRARFGLDVVQKLQEASHDQVSVIEDSEGSDEQVDDVLVSLALEHDASLYTTDYNLNKVARIHGVPVLNVNELAHALRPIHLPGESVTVKIVQKGEAHSQGVGYLEDGTMTVVEGAAQRIGQHVTAEVERMLQTEAGKMVFARMGRGNGNGAGHQQRKAPSANRQRNKRSSS